MIQRIDRREIAQMLQSRVQPGQSYAIDGGVMRQVAPIQMALGHSWHPADSILENIPGAGYEWSWHEDRMNDKFIFTRRKEPTNGDVRTYVSPDRRHQFSKTSDGLFVRVHAEPTRLRIVPKNS